MKLTGLRVIDLSVFLPGPYLTLALADHGAFGAELAGQLGEIGGKVLPHALSNRAKAAEADVEGEGFGHDFGVEVVPGAPAGFFTNFQSARIGTPANPFTVPFSGIGPIVVDPGVQ